jgi:hypothetical protein
MAFAVPVNVIVAAPPGHTVVLPLIVTTGKGTTVTVTDPDCDWLHGVVPPTAALTRLNAVVVE